METNQNKNEEIKKEEQLAKEESSTSVDKEMPKEETENQKNKDKNKHKHYDVTKDPKYIELVELNAKLKDQLLRQQAEFDNYRKRVNEERQKEKKYYLQDFLDESIETLDILDKAVNTKTEDEMLKKYLNGFIMINNRLKMVLESYGVKQMDCLNKPFDYKLHDAVDTIEKEGVEPNIVVEVIRTGYMYKDRVLRPAMVKVSK